MTTAAIVARLARGFWRRSWQEVHEEWLKVIEDGYSGVHKDGELMVESLSDLVDLAWAEQQAMDYYAQERAKYAFQTSMDGTLAPARPSRRQ